jgi:CHAT domain-containing protein/Tfp pilus assembly protein PilF
MKKAGGVLPDCLMGFWLFLLLTFNNVVVDPFGFFARVLISAQTEAERASLLEQNPDLVGIPLRDALVKEAKALNLKAEHEKARRVSDLAIQIATSINDQAGLTLALNQRAHSYLGEENFAECEKDLAKAITISQPLPDQEPYALVTQSLGMLYAEQQKYEEALRQYEEALQVFKDLNHSKGRAITYNLMANIYDYQGNPKKALELYEESITLYEQISDSVGAARVLVNRATIYSDMGRNDLSFESYLKAQKVFEATGEKNSLAIVLSNIGANYSESGNYRMSLQYAVEALKLREELGKERGIASSLINIGYVHEVQGNYELSLDLYLRAEAIIQRVGDKYLQGIVFNNIGGMYALTERYESALKYFEKSRVVREQLGNKSGVGSVFFSIAGTYELMGRLKEAFQYYQKTLAAFEELNMKPRAAEALLGLSKVSFSQKDYDQSERFADRAFELIRQLEFPDLMSSVLTQQAKILLHKRDFKKAEQRLLQAIEMVESLRQQVAGAEIASQQFLTSREEPFYLMVDLLVEQNREVEAFQYVERIRGRALLDVLQNGRIEVTKQMTAEEAATEKDLKSELRIANNLLEMEKSQENPDAARVSKLRNQVHAARMALENFQTNLYAIHPALRTQRADISSIDQEKIANLLQRESAILEFSVSKERTFLFVWTKENERAQLHIIRKPVQQKLLAELAKAYREQLETRNLRIEQTSRKLYDFLFRPAEHYLDGKRSIIVIPDRGLWDLPFQALQSSNMGQSVLERFSISYAPSLSVLYEMKNSSNRTAPSFALLGLASSIPAAQTEVEMLSRFYGTQTSRIYTGAKARESVLKKEASDYKIIHLATHGVLDNTSPMYSYLQFEKEKTEDGLLEPWEVMNLDLNSSLVVLSSCETGRGQIRAGEGIIGFTWALFVAGSPSSVVSEWKVDSESTALLMAEFHQNLTKRKLSKPEALRQAALKVRANPKFRHPYYWAPFIVVGDPSPI